MVVFYIRFHSTFTGANAFDEIRYDRGLNACGFAVWDFVCARETFSLCEYAMSLCPPAHVVSWSSRKCFTLSLFSFTPWLHLLLLNMKVALCVIGRMQSKLNLNWSIANLIHKYAMYLVWLFAHRCRARHSQHCETKTKDKHRQQQQQEKSDEKISNWKCAALLSVCEIDTNKTTILPAKYEIMHKVNSSPIKMSLLERCRRRGGRGRRSLSPWSPWSSSSSSSKCNIATRVCARNFTFAISVLFNLMPPNVKMGEMKKINKTIRK